ncbi:MAG TPA: DUF4159 domain-containing protein [Bryobacteraceae bacterium]|nr:DUF4159 domain-containing protein [Bryobacteraceae bacterium]
MRVRSFLLLFILGLTGWGVLRAQRPFKAYRGQEYEDYPLPEDWKRAAEFTRARLRYPSFLVVHPPVRDGFDRWTIDYPPSDRHLLQGIRRLTRIDTRSVEQVVDLDYEEDRDDVYNWPFMYAVEVGYWNLTDRQAAQLRDFLLRGGFFMCDDFHGSVEWANFTASMKRVFPDREIVDLDNKDPIFHVIYDLDDRYQVPGLQYVYTHSRFEYDGFQAKWRGIYDDKGRLMVVICHNMDLGDAWEHSDNPVYPEPFAALAYRIAVNYVVYDLTH